MDDELMAMLAEPIKMFMSSDNPCGCWCHSPAYWGHHWGRPCCEEEGQWSYDPMGDYLPMSPAQTDRQTILMAALSPTDPSR